MAGIGFQLKKLIREDRYTSDFKANLYSLLISAGPWLFAVLCIAALSLLSYPFLRNEHLLLFRAIIIYVYAFSLIFTSIFQLVLTRYISDKLYQREFTSLLPNFIGAMALCGIGSFLIALIYSYFTQLDFLTRFLCIVLFCAVSFQWVIVVFLSSVRDYLHVTAVFFVGFFLSFVAAVIMGLNWGVIGYITGFTSGQVIIVVFLTSRIFQEFPMGKDSIFDFLNYFKLYPQLVWTAFLYNLGFWIDKILVWYSPLGFSINNSFRAHYPYDTATFLAILSIIPAMAIFFLQVETDFYEGLRKYINTILQKGTYIEIEHKRKSLIKMLREKIAYLVKIQFLVTIILFILGPSIIAFFGFNKYEVGSTFMIVLIGAFFQILFLTLVVLCWYLDFLNEALISTIIFALLNFGLNYYFIYYTKLTLGLGYLLSAFLSFAIIYIILHFKIKDLNYIVFLQRPIREGQVTMPKYE